MTSKSAEFSKRAANMHPPPEPAIPNPQHDSTQDTGQTHPLPVQSQPASILVAQGSNIPPVPRSLNNMGPTNLPDAMRNLQLCKNLEEELPLNPSDATNDRQLRENGLFDDDQTHLSNSSTKLTSFDSKSMASVTTFGMDEKDSLRPDDSASVQAVDEDDYLASMASTSNVPGLLSINPIPNALVTGGLIPTESQRPGGENPRLTAVLSSAAAVSLNPGEPTLHGFPCDPDEKLMEAMNSPKDRLLLLQLEEKIISFIKNSTDGSLELPPCNSFGRLLAHKLGDYYHLTHFVDNNVTSVRLHRTPWSRLPTPLSMLQAANTNTPPLTAPTMKIMRRIGQMGEKGSVGGSTAPSSSVPSKTVSESGVDTPNEDERDDNTSSAGATPAKDRSALTREEREAKYQEARERIFRDFPESKSDSPSTGGNSPDVSRSSSKAGRKKPQRQRPSNDDGFEARSQFNAYYTHPHLPGGQLMFNNIPQEGIAAPHNYYLFGQTSPNVGIPFPPGNPGNSLYTPPGNPNALPQYSPVSTHHAQAAWSGGQSPQANTGFLPYYQPAQMSPVMPHQSTRSSPRSNTYGLSNSPQFTQQSPTWGQSSFPPNFISSSPGRPSPPVHWPSMPPNPMAYNPMPYPHHSGPNQSFIPSKSTQSSPMGMSRPRMNQQHRSFTPSGSPLSSYPDHTSQPTTFPRYGHGPINSNSWPNSRDHSRPGVNKTLPAQSVKGVPSSHQSGHRNHHENPDSIAKWGTPSHLPPKPPPPEMPFHIDTTNRATAAPAPDIPHVASPKTSGPFVVSGAPTHNPQSLGDSSAK
ncbi:hypothetical protein FQN57_000913 [Myotisia sp. PD_48]|nr:hypothetical protein FQN57_000913 [Myotisia sp. PD_48]